MQKSSILTRPLLIVQKGLMVVGLLIFMIFGSAVAIEAGSKDVTINTHEPQPELQASAIFSR